MDTTIWTCMHPRAALGKLERLAIGDAFVTSMVQALNAALGVISQLTCYCDRVGSKDS